MAASDSHAGQELCGKGAARRDSSDANGLTKPIGGALCEGVRRAWPGGMSGFNRNMVCT